MVKRFWARFKSLFQKSLFRFAWIDKNKKRQTTEAEVLADEVRSSVVRKSIEEFMASIACYPRVRRPSNRDNIQPQPADWYKEEKELVQGVDFERFKVVCRPAASNQKD